LGSNRVTYRKVWERLGEQSRDVQEGMGAFGEQSRDVQEGMGAFGGAIA
jgi:hypothetical protein